MAEDRQILDLIRACAEADTSAEYAGRTAQLASEAAQTAQRNSMRLHRELRELQDAMILKLREMA